MPRLAECCGGWLRNYTPGAQLGFGGARTAIDGVAFIITGDPEYYYAKHHSVHGYKPSPK